MKIQPCRNLFSNISVHKKVSVIIPLYNYEGYIIDTLNSVAEQTFKDLSIVVVDDCSTDRSSEVVTSWMQAHQDQGMAMGLWRNESNARLALTRNTGIALHASEYCFFLDADNLIYPRCIEKHVAAMDARPDAAAAYSLIEVFGSRTGLIGTGVFDRVALSHGNFIDAMTMIRHSDLTELGGFEHIDHGWEDFELWLRFCETDRIAVHIPEILSRYREHAASMLRTDTNLPDNIKRLHAEISRRHPWVDLH